MGSMSDWQMLTLRASCIKGIMNPRTSNIAILLIMIDPATFEAFGFIQLNYFYLALAVCGIKLWCMPMKFCDSNRKQKNWDIIGPLFFKPNFTLGRCYSHSEDVRLLVEALEDDNSICLICFILQRN